jgi:hypothetical protein
MCIYALDVYDWNDLGRTEHLPARAALVVMCPHPRGCHRSQEVLVRHTAPKSQRNKAI